MSASLITLRMQEEEGVTSLHAESNTGVCGPGHRHYKAPRFSLKMQINLSFSCCWYLNFSSHLCGEHARLD